MKNNSAQGFLDELAHSEPDPIDKQFLINYDRLGLGGFFSRNELILLYEAARLAAFCQVAFNEVALRQGEAVRDREIRRNELEQVFLEARDSLYASPGWQELQSSAREAISRSFLDTYVLETNLAR